MRAARSLITRRTFLAGAGAAAGLGVSGGRSAPAGSAEPKTGPIVTHGVQSGDVNTSSGVVWARCDRPARMIVEVSTTESFSDGRLLRGPAALENTDFTARLDLNGLPSGREIFYRVRFADLADVGTIGEPTVGRFVTAPANNDERDVVFVWGGDVAGQGWGINPEWGGMRSFATMRAVQPDFFLHCGDTVYADNPMVAEVPLANGEVWKNLLIPEKTKVAETLAEFRGQFKYNLLDEHVRRFAAEVPVFATWDDHETVNNWYPDEMLTSERYTTRSASLLAARGNRAFHEFMPIRRPSADPERIYRVVHYGPMLDVFILDMRSYRGANGPNRQAEPGPESAFLGPAQVTWLKEQLAASTATWKIIAASMPIGLARRDGPDAYEAIANRDGGPPLGREHEIAEILRSAKANRVRNMVWLTADVHYTAAHFYDPAQARFSDFDGFWEFVSGPLHASTGSRADLDETFGPTVVFEKSAGGVKGLPPSAGLQFFGEVRIARGGTAMSVTLRDLSGAALHRVDLVAQ